MGKADMPKPEIEVVVGERDLLPILVPALLHALSGTTEVTATAANRRHAIATARNILRSLRASGHWITPIEVGAS
jgi:hypothetical protein